MTEKQAAGGGSPNPDFKRDPAIERTLLERALNVIEVVGNKLPDPAVLFFLLMIAVWIASAFLAQFTFSAIHPSTGEPIQVINQLSGGQMANFMVNMVSVFVNFA
ncbi:MAG: AbgT family transporter, partial [Wenzhouxiangella sp.]|nr:AbgT family transporter [Wenzhouxiangella sp.]